MDETVYNFSYCSQDFENFGKEMNPIVFNINLAICVAGICANIVNMIIFSRTSMQNSTNFLLGGIALADIIVMVAYIPEYFAKIPMIEDAYPYAAAVIWITHEYFLSVFHPISVWMTTTVSIWRYLAVLHPQKYTKICTMRLTKILMGVIFIFNILITIPGYLAAHVVEGDAGKTWKDGGCGSSYCPKWEEFGPLRKIEFIYHGFATKILTSLIMTFVIVRLICALLRAKNDLKSLTKMDSVKSSRCLEDNQNNPQKSNSKREFDRTTRMLLVLLLVFLVTELPPSIVYILEVAYGPTFYFECRRPIHYLILMAYFASGMLNFCIYMTMSARFRLTFKHTFTRFCKGAGADIKNSGSLSLGSNSSRDNDSVTGKIPMTTI